jgi:hypothetical protein
VVVAKRRGRNEKEGKEKREEKEKRKGKDNTVRYQIWRT